MLQLQRPQPGTACDHLRRRMGPDRTQRPRRSGDMAFIYEDPALDANLNDDLALRPMGWSEHSLAGRAGPDGRRDLTVHEIARRFDHATNAGVSTEERWGIDNGSRSFRGYEHRDLGLMTAAMTETTQILDGHFTAYAALGPITPTIMAAGRNGTGPPTLTHCATTILTLRGTLLRVNIA